MEEMLGEKKRHKGMCHRNKGEGVKAVCKVIRRSGNTAFWRQHSTLRKKKRNTRFLLRRTKKTAVYDKPIASIPTNETHLQCVEFLLR